MKNFLVIGNPIEHSISPKLHNYWFKETKIDAIYQKQQLDENQLNEFINRIREKKLDGANITLPFKEKIIKFVDKLTDEAKEANSVNTIYLSNNSVVGHNTDIAGFYLSLNKSNLNFPNTKALIFGSGGVTPSIIIGLRKFGVKNIFISNRTVEKAIKLKERFKFLEVIEWGKSVKSNLVINTTSLGLKSSDNIELDYSSFDPESFFYDVIYKPTETNFLLNAKKRGHKTQNGLLMFLYQASEAFKKWHKIEPKIDKNLLNFLNND
tara:strand:+ start:189 stop:986 length:798 start_codon:yes stop_codon:yes gene_type:complete